VAARRFGWQAGRSRIHRTGSCDRRARHAQAAPKSRPARAAGCATARPGPEPELIPQSRLLAVPRLPRAATPPRRQVSRRPMVTVIRPSRARCVKATIPRHERAVFTFKGGQDAGPPWEILYPWARGRSPFHLDRLDVHSADRSRRYGRTGRAQRAGVISELMSLNLKHFW